MGRQHNSNLKDVWQTPDEILDLILAGGSIDLDPCAAPDTDIGATNYTEEDDGLSQDWHGRVFVNPPFSKKEKFLEKAIEEQDSADAIFVVTPDSTDTESWWHKYIAAEADYVWFSEGRIGYINPESGEQRRSAAFGTAISIFGEPCDDVLDELDSAGQLVKTVRR